jgi:hypothetical protein
VSLRRAVGQQMEQNKDKNTWARARTEPPGKIRSRSRVHWERSGKDGSVVQKVVSNREASNKIH